MKVLHEMAYERRDAINRCADLGKPFIEHFKKIIDTGIQDKDFNHHCHEMQTWFNDVKNITLKYNNKHLSNSQLMDWFFTIGSDTETLLEDSYRELYEDFIISLLVNKDVKECFILLFK